MIHAIKYLDNSLTTVESKLIYCEAKTTCIQYLLNIGDFETLETVNLRTVKRYIENAISYLNFKSLDNKITINNLYELKSILENANLFLVTTIETGLLALIDTTKNIELRTDVKKHLIDVLNCINDCVNVIKTLEENHKTQVEVCQN